MAAPQSDNSLVDTVIGVFNGVVKILVSFAEAVVEGQFPFLNFFPLKQIFQFIVNWAENRALAEADKEIAKVVIDHQVDAELEKTNKAKADLEHAIASGDADEIKKQREKFDKSVADLVHYDGSHNKH